MSMKEVLKTSKPWIYLGNIGARILGKRTGLDAIVGTPLGDPIGAVIFGLTDVVGAFSDKVKNSKYVKLAKLGGAVGYGAKTLFFDAAPILGATVKSAYSLFNGDSITQPWENVDFSKELVQTLSYGSMAFQLWKDSLKNYWGSGSVTGDLKSIFGKSGR